MSGDESRRLMNAEIRRAAGRAEALLASVEASAIPSFDGGVRTTATTANPNQPIAELLAKARHGQREVVDRNVGRPAR